MSSEEDFYYSSGEDEVAEDSGGEEEPDCTTPAAAGPQKSYTILNEEKIKQLQDEDISEVCNVLFVSRALASILLHRKNWNVSSVFDEWFADEEKVRESIGLLSEQKSGDQDYCKICFDSFEDGSILSAACGHPFCPDCMKSYISVAITDGPGCLSLRCPEPKCRARIGLDMIDQLATEDEKEKYYRFHLRSYVEGSRKVKWCPAPGCEFAVQFDAGGSDTYVVTCDCSHWFCWNCLEENHRPVSCVTVDDWVKQQTSEAENNTWIACFTKQCPKCHRNIEKNQGCNHMTCGEPCGFEFCWLCLGPWTEHANRVCNMYEEQPEVAFNPDAEGSGKDDKQKSLLAKRRYLVRYAHFYERWALNHRSRETALEDMEKARSQHIKVLARAQAEPEGLLEFIMDAWAQIAECRRVLKWTYAYGYFLSMERSGKMRFFEYLQGEAETALERLHHCAEKEMETYMKADSPSEDFKNFRAKLICLTGATKNYFENLVRALENDLAEVENFVLPAKSPKKSATEEANSSGNQEWYYDDPEQVEWEATPEVEEVPDLDL